MLKWARKRHGLRIRSVKERSTADVLEDHLRCRKADKLEEDLEHNYAPDVVLLCEHGALQGIDAVKRSADELARQLPDAQFEYVVKRLKDNYANIQWTADSATNYVEDGADTFVIRNGRVAMQSVFYRLKPKLHSLGN